MGENDQTETAIRPIRMRLKITFGEFIFTLYQKYKEGATDSQIFDWIASLELPDIPEKERFYPTAESLAALRKDSEAAVKADLPGLVPAMQEWCKSNTHLPQPEADIILKFLWAAKGNEDRCKKLISNFYTLRATDEELFANRDPCLPEPMEFQKHCAIATLPILTKEFYRVTVSRINTSDPDLFCAKQYIRRLLAISDLRVKYDFCLGDIVIYDMQHYSTAHMLKFTPALVKRMIVASEGALPTRIKALHMVNCPSWIDKVTNMIKPFLREKIASRIHIHMDGYEELYKSVPKHHLPTEFGGTLGPIADFNERWTKEMIDHRDWFISEEKTSKRIYLEAKNSGKTIADSSDLFGMEGSFKKLDID